MADRTRLVLDSCDVEPIRGTKVLACHQGEGQTYSVWE